MFEMLSQLLLFVLVGRDFLTLAGQVTPPPPPPPTFDVLRNTSFFVDKTLLIQDFLLGEGPRQMVLQARRGFGKTTNLDMLHRFLEMDVLPDGSKQRDKMSHSSYHTFITRVPSTKRFLDVFREKPLFNFHFGEYPVVWLDLHPKGAKFPTEEAFTRHLLNGTVRNAFNHHSYLLNSTAVSPEEKTHLKKYLILNSTSDVTPHHGIALLKTLLKRHFQADPIVLVDNVDARLREVIFDPKQGPDAIGKLEILTSLTEATSYPGGIAEPCRTLFTCVLLPQQGSQLNYWFGRKFDGFSEFAMETMITRPSLKKRMPFITAWYGGFGDRYNPNSVISYLTTIGRKVYKPLWSELGSLDTFKLAFAPDCFGKTIMKCYEECKFPPKNVSSYFQVFPEAMRHIKNLQKLTLPIEASKCSRDTLLYFIDLLETLGYLTRTGWVRGPRQDYLTYRVPNLEVKSDISRLLYEAIVSETSLNGDASFRLELFETIAGVNESESSMASFAKVLTKLFVASKREGRAVEGTLVHSVRVHLLHPPPEIKFFIKYVQTGPSEDLTEEDLNERRSEPNFDIVFVIATKNTSTGFVVKFDSDKDPKPGEKTLSQEYLDVFLTGNQKNVTVASTVKVLANLRFHGSTCTLNYLYNSTSLDEQKRLEFNVEG